MPSHLHRDKLNGYIHICSITNKVTAFQVAILYAVHIVDTNT